MILLHWLSIFVSFLLDFIPLPCLLRCDFELQTGNLKVLLHAEIKR